MNKEENSKCAVKKLRVLRVSLKQETGGQQQVGRQPRKERARERESKRLYTLIRNGKASQLQRAFDVPRLVFGWFSP